MRQGVGAEGMTTSGDRARRRRRRSTSTTSRRSSPRDRALGYTDKHPDIIRLQQEIKQARADLAAAKADQPANREETLKADPIYRQKLQERDMAAAAHQGAAGRLGQRAARRSATTRAASKPRRSSSRS